MITATLHYIRQALTQLIKPSTRNSLPVLSNVLIEAQETERGQVLTLTTTDLDTYTRATVPAQFRTDAPKIATSARADILKEIAAALDQRAPVSFADVEGERANLRISSARSEYHLHTVAADEFPRFPQIAADAPQATTRADSLAAAIREVLPFTAKGERGPIAGILCEYTPPSLPGLFARGSITLTATDGIKRRSATVETCTNDQANDQATLAILNPSAARTMLPALDATPLEPASLTFGASHIALNLPTFEIAGRTIDGEFPSARHYTITATTHIPRKEFSKILARLKPLALADEGRFEIETVGDILHVYAGRFYQNATEQIPHDGQAIAHTAASWKEAAAVVKASKAAEIVLQLATEETGEGPQTRLVIDDLIIQTTELREVTTARETAARLALYERFQSISAEELGQQIADIFAKQLRATPYRTHRTIKGQEIIEGNVSRAAGEFPEDWRKELLYRVHDYLFQSNVIYKDGGVTLTFAQKTLRAVSRVEATRRSIARQRIAELVEATCSRLKDKKRAAILRLAQAIADDHETDIQHESLCVTSYFTKADARDIRERVDQILKQAYADACESVEDFGEAPSDETPDNDPSDAETEAHYTPAPATEIPAQTLPVASEGNGKEVADVATLPATSEPIEEEKPKLFHVKQSRTPLEKMTDEELQRVRERSLNEIIAACAQDQRRGSWSMKGQIYRREKKQRAANRIDRVDAILRARAMAQQQETEPEVETVSRETPIQIPATKIVSRETVAKPLPPFGASIALYASHDFTKIYQQFGIVYSDLIRERGPPFDNGF